jgi:hypothetical protein
MGSKFGDWSNTDRCRTITTGDDFRAFIRWYVRDLYIPWWPTTQHKKKKNCSPCLLEWQGCAAPSIPLSSLTQTILIQIATELSTPIITTQPSLTSSTHSSRIVSPVGVNGISIGALESQSVLDVATLGGVGISAINSWLFGLSVTTTIPVTISSQDIGEQSAQSSVEVVTIAGVGIQVMNSQSLSISVTPAGVLNNYQTTPPGAVASSQAGLFSSLAGNPSFTANPIITPSPSTYVQVSSQSCSTCSFSTLSSGVNSARSSSLAEVALEVDQSLLLKTLATKILPSFLM